MGGVRGWRGRIAAAAFGGALLLVPGCDRRDERIENARGLVDAAIDQVSGGTAAPPNAADAMAQATTAERALSGAFGGEESLGFAPANSRFVIGSIIAKPKDTREFQIKSAPVIRSFETAPAPSADDGGGVRGAGERPTLPSREQLRALRKDPLEDWELKVQLDARSKMIDVMAKYGLEGEVKPSRAGLMQIDFGDDVVDPTQLREKVDLGELRDKRPRMVDIRPPNPRSPAARLNWALNERRQCPDKPSPSLMRRDKALATECVIEELKASNDFEYVEKDFIFDHQFARRPVSSPTPASVAPNDPLWSLQWHFQSNGDSDGASLGGAGFSDFWGRRAVRGSTDVVVAVIDTGLELDHPDIVTSPNIAPGWDMVTDPETGNDGDGRDPDPDDPGDICDPDEPFAENSYHGTHVAGTIGAAATDNASGVAGGAWSVTIVPVRALGKCGGRLSDINDAIRWAGGLIPADDGQGGEVWNENPADIINLSIGLFEFCPASLQDAINAVTERGAVVVSAAGNARVSTSFYAPAGCNNVVTAAAGDARGVLAPYSNFGDEVDVLAPGGDLARDDNNDGRPDGVLSTKSAANCLDPLTGEAIETCYYAFEHGTSMAAPHVSAALALIKAAEPRKTGSELVAELLGAVRERSPEQCMRPCIETSGAPVPGRPDMCEAACGVGLLDLGLLTE